ncbi:MAG TPA: agmatine deiminase family protein [Ilumatobacteraceae bacterium]
MTGAAAAGFVMPPEWAAHERTWMEFPPANETFGEDADAELAEARRAWSAVVNAIARFEPVSLICNVGDAAAARALVDPAVSIHETAINESWFRDSGPTFVTHPSGRLGAVHWRFNGWGQQDFCEWNDEQHTGAFAAALAGAELFTSTMVNEGGGIHVDGDGTVLVTRTVQLDPGRNPDWDEAAVEAELIAQLGVAKVLWMPRGLTKDYARFGTRGHIDMIAAFVRPGVVVAHAQPDTAHPDHDVCRENIAILRSMTDARGRQLEVVELAAPTVTHTETGIVDWSYVNHYVCNGAVILCAFGDPRDAEAATTLSRLYPGRDVVLVDAREIFDGGGGIHCITQQQPAS